MKILLVAVNSKFIHSNPAVHMLKAASGVSSSQVEIAEYAINQRTEDILADIYNRKPDVLCISCYIWNIQMVEEIIQDIESILPDIHIWLGGPEVSFNAAEVIKKYPFIKGVMVGEGEESFRELTSFYINKDIKLTAIKGLYINEEDDAVFTGERQLTDIDSIPFIYDDMSIFDNKIIYYESSRGCPFRCSYCLSSIDKTVRLRSLDKVFVEIQFFLNHKLPQVKFIDRTFNCNKKHAIAIWKYLLEHDNGITNFHFEIAADLICQEELEIISKMRPGLIQLEIGVQSTNLKTIAEINRRMDLEKLREVVAKIHSFGNTHQHLDLIAGLPYEDIGSFENSFNDVYSMKPDQLQLGFLKVLKGSHMEEMISDYRIKYSANAPYEVLSTKWISYEDIRLLKGIEEMVELYYNTNQFSHTIKYMESRFESPFIMYKKLSEDYIAKGYDIRKPARSYRYEMLYNFVKEYDSKNDEIYRELLTIDSYLRENCKLRPVFARDLSDYKQDIRSKEKDKKNHIDVFLYVNPLTGELKENTAPLFIQFDYSNRNPLNHNAVMSEL